MLSQKTALCCAMICLLNSASSHADTLTSAKVEQYLVQASVAGHWLEQGDLVRMEEALAPGYAEITLMMDSYQPDGRTNAYLMKRGWGHLVWTQMMYRLLAIRDGLYDREMDFAERVALESESNRALATVELSVERMNALLAVKDQLNLGQAIDQFAQGLLDPASATVGYEDLVSDFQSRFVLRNLAVKARLASGIHRGIVDPADLPAGTYFAHAYEVHQERLASENRLDEILNRLIRVDSGHLQGLAEIAQNGATQAEREAARHEVKLQLLLVEDSLDAYEHDPDVAELFAFCDRWGHLAFERSSGYPDDFQEVMFLVYKARRNLAEQTRPDKIRDLYAIADLVR